LTLGLAFFAAGIVAFLESKLGLSPWDVLHQGIAIHSPLSFGMANIAVGVVVVSIAWLLGAKIGVATLANALLVGAFIELLTSFEAIDRLSEESLGVRIGLLAAGVVLVGLGSGLYLGADLGAGPRDSLMLVGVERTSLRVAIVRGFLELGALAVGFVLGGTIGRRDRRLRNPDRPLGGGVVLGSEEKRPCDYGVSVTDSIVTASRGLSRESAATCEIASATSMPSTTRPKTVCFPSSHGQASAVTMKNWLPFVFGPAFAIARAPRTTRCSLGSSSNV
jgi:uncharacterized membrane protein YczE